MVLISHNIGCRNCLKSDGVRHAYSLMDSNIDEFQNKTEFYVIMLIEELREQDNDACDFCGSKNVEILEVEVDGKKLYDYDKIAERCEYNNEYMLQINIDKRGSNLDINIGGSQQFEKNFLKQAFSEIYSLIISRPDSHFKTFSNGNMFICVTGGADLVEIETYRSAGISKEQIISTIQNFIDRTKIPVDFSSTPIFSKKFELNFTFKSSDHLRYENGIHVSGPHGGARRAVKVEPNIAGGQGVTVSIYNIDGNHPIWQNNVQMAPKQMKVIIETNDKIVLQGYGYDAMGSSFADYGLTINLKNGNLENCVLHMLDRDIDIKYLP